MTGKSDAREATQKVLASVYSDGTSRIRLLNSKREVKMTGRAPLSLEDLSPRPCAHRAHQQVGKTSLSRILSIVFGQLTTVQLPPPLSVLLFVTVHSQLGC